MATNAQIVKLVQKTGKQFGQNIGKHEAKLIAALLIGRTGQILKGDK